MSTNTFFDKLVANQFAKGTKMKLSAVAICAFIFHMPFVSWAGTPTDETVVCPVGGEKFTKTGTASCSTMGRTMSFKPITSCDFVTLLPICPSNGLPMYQEFSEEQIANLEEFIESANFAQLKQLPPWQRAYGVSKHLGQSGTATAFGLLLSSMWYETDVFINNEEILDQFLAESDRELERATAQDKPFLDAIVGYALMASGRVDQAEVRLDRASETADAPEFLLQYISAIRACQSNMERDGCKPHDRFNP
ncbi:MAG: tetratricopeptide repeat protein [Paracoccaceae bacterium]